MASGWHPWGIVTFYLTSNDLCKIVTEQNEPSTSLLWALDIYLLISISKKQLFIEYLVLIQNMKKKLCILCIFDRKKTRQSLWFYGIEHLWIGDPWILRHLIGPCHCSVPPLRPPRCKAISLLLLLPHRGTALLLNADLLSSTLPWNLPSMQLFVDQTDMLSVQQWRQGDGGG